MSITGEVTPEPVDIRGDVTVVMKGEDGLSAYEVAVKNGFVGTEEEWLESLKGEARNAEAYTREAQQYSLSAQNSSAAANSFALAAEDYKNEAQAIKDSISPEVQLAITAIQEEKAEAEAKKSEVDAEAEQARLDRVQADADAAEVRYLYGETIIQKNVATDAAERARRYAQGIVDRRDEMLEIEARARDYAAQAESDAESAHQSAESASHSMTLASHEAYEARQSAILASYEAYEAKQSAESAAHSMTLASLEAYNAQQSAIAAATSAALAVQQAARSEEIRIEVSGYKDDVVLLASSAVQSATLASYEAYEAKRSAEAAEHSMTLASHEAYSAKQSAALASYEAYSAHQSAQAAARSMELASFEAYQAQQWAIDAHSSAMAAGNAETIVSDAIDIISQNTLNIVQNELDIQLAAMTTSMMTLASSTTQSISDLDVRLSDEITLLASSTTQQINTLTSSMITGLDNKLDVLGTAVLAENALRVNGHTVESDVPPNAVFTDTTYDTMTISEAETGTDTTGKLVPAKVLADFVAEVIAALVASAPGTLDTLNELAAALGDDPNFATTVATELGKKLDKAGGTMTGNLTVQGTVTADSLVGNVTGNATNVTGTVAIANGGTGATTRLGAVQNLLGEAVSTNAQHFFTLTDNFAKAGWTSVANAKTVLDLVDKSSTQQITGVKAFTAYPLAIRNTGFTKGTNPSSQIWFTMNMCDKNGTAFAANSVGCFETSVKADGTVYSAMRAVKNVENSSDSCTIQCAYDTSNNTVNTYAPTPNANSNDNNIATTAWVRSNAVDITSAQTISGNKTFSGTVTLTKSTDASGTANNSPALIVGGAATAAHIEMDGNEIMAKGNGTTTAVLYINNDGGNVTVGSGGITTSGKLIISATSDQIRIKRGNYSIMFHNDGSNFYLLKTASGSADGTWDSTRPLTVNLSTGGCNINGNAATATKISGKTIPVVSSFSNGTLALTSLS